MNRRSIDGIPSQDQHDLTLSARTDKHAAKPRRRGSLASRRPSTSCHPHVFGLNKDAIDKENRFTSTPIKSDEYVASEALRDVSNITPKDGAKRRVITKRKSLKNVIDNESRNMTIIPKNKRRKKKKCTDPLHSQKFLFERKCKDFCYFKPCEDIDSNSETLNSVCAQKSTSTKRQIQETYAPTLPSFENESSPEEYKTMYGLHALNYTQTPFRVPPIFSHIQSTVKYDERIPTNKRSIINHVNDFLHQISFLSSSTQFCQMKTNNEVSPLVKKFVDLSFNNTRHKLNNSSYISDLSLDKLVDMILDASGDLKQRPTPATINQVKGNDVHEQCEENVVNSKQEHNCHSNSNKSSTDSGFRSASNERSHAVDSNFVFKCNNNNPREKVVEAYNYEVQCDKTIIHLDETYNERCVDGGPAICQNSTLPTSKMKRSLEGDPNTYKLKRQKCVRRKKHSETPDVKFCDKTTMDKTVSSEVLWSSGIDSNLVNDDNYFSSTFDDKNKEGSEPEVEFRTPSQEFVASNGLQNGTITEALTGSVVSLRKIRRCLSFDSPISECSSVSSKCHVTGTIELDLCCNHRQLLVKGNLFIFIGVRLICYV